MLPVPRSRNVGVPTLGLSLPSGHSQGPIAGDPLGSSHSEHPCACSPAVLYSAGALSRPSFGQERGQLHSSSPLGPRGLVFSRQDKEVSQTVLPGGPGSWEPGLPPRPGALQELLWGNTPVPPSNPEVGTPLPPGVSQARPAMISKQSWSHSRFAQGSGELSQMPQDPARQPLLRWSQVLAGCSNTRRARNVAGGVVTRL